MTADNPVIGVVGPCASGKSTLVAALRLLGYEVRHIAQEHSYVSEMWQMICNPDFLIYLDVSFEVSAFRTGTNWFQGIFNNQIHRLDHARNNADLYILTDDLTPDQVLNQVLNILD